MSQMVLSSAETADFNITDDFFITPSDVLVGPQIGLGQFGSVHFGRYFGDAVAIKVQNMPKGVSLKGGTLSGYLMRELSILKNARHEQLLEYIGACECFKEGADQPATLYIVTEFAHNGDLLSLLTSSHPLGFNFLTRIMLSAIDGLNFLHEKGIIHRDIKSENILLDENWGVKVSDFGMAREVGNGTGSVKGDRATHQMSICGTDGYMAPELMFDEEYSYPADIFSFGLVIFEILARTPVGKDGFCERFPGKNFKLDYEEIKAKLHEDAPLSLVELAVICSDYEAEDRPTATDVVSWIQDTLQNMNFDEVDPPPTKEEPSVDDNDMECIAAPTLAAAHSEGGSGEGESRRDSTGSNTSLRSVKSEKEDDRRVAFALTKQISEKVMNYEQKKEPAKMKMGWLYKRNRSGFRNWKKRWFVLKGAELAWYISHEEVFSGSTWGKPHGTLNLKNNVLIRGTSGFRFQLLDCDDLDNVNDTRLHNREVAALNEKDLEEWFAALEEHIEEANSGGAMKRVSKHVGRTQSQDSNDPEVDIKVTRPIIGAAAGQGEKEEGRREGATAKLEKQASGVFGSFQTPKEWLKALGLAEYCKNFASKPELTMGIIEEIGVSEKDLDELVITDDFARRLILESSKGGFCPDIQCDCTGARDFGDVIVFKVQSKFRTRRSVVYMRFSDFVKMQAKFRQAMKDLPLLLSLMPSLPGKGIWESRTANRDRKFVAERQKNLGLWLRELALVAGRDPACLKLLVQHLELHTST